MPASAEKVTKDKRAVRSIPGLRTPDPAGASPRSVDILSNAGMCLRGNLLTYPSPPLDLSSRSTV